MLMNRILHYFKYTLLCTFIHSLSLKAEIVKLLEIPSGTGGWLTYAVEAPKKCSFSGVKNLLLPDLDQGEKGNILLDKLNFYQRKINLEIERQEITSEKILFSLKGSRNLTFAFSYDPDCKLKKVLHLNKKQYDIDEIDVEYNDILLSPVVEKLRFKNGEDADLLLYPWALRGQMSSYEFNLGIAANIHSNIRKNNTKNFENTDPVLEPIPAFFFRYGPFFLNKNGMGSLVFYWKDLSILAMGVSEGEPYSTSGLIDRNRGIFLGSIAKYGIVDVTYYNDFFEDKGYNVKATIAPEFYLDLHWKLSPQFSVQFWDKKYVNYYYGVRPQELQSGYPVYETDGTLNYALMFETVHFIQKWTFIGSAGMKFYGSEVYHSPTVNRKNEVRLIASILYKIF